MKLRETSTGRPRMVAWPNIDVLQWLRDRLIAAGRDPTVIPDEPFALWRLPTVKERIGNPSTSTIYRGVANGTFPKPVSIDGSHREG